MNKKVILMAMLIGAPFWGVAASAEPSVEEQIEKASMALQQAAEKLAKLHSKQYTGGDHAKRAMLGILLGSEKMVGGVPIVGTTPKGGAAEAGLLAGDMIVQIDGKDLTQVEDPLGVLSKHMKTLSPGDVVLVEYLRDAQRVQAAITTRARSDHVMTMINKGLDGLRDLDIEIDLEKLEKLNAITSEVTVNTRSDQLMAVSGDLAKYFDVDAGVVVTQPAEASELLAGDVLLRVGDTEVSDVAGAIEALAQIEGEAPVRIKRKGRTRTVDVKQDEFDTLVKKELHVIKIRGDD